MDWEHIAVALLAGVVVLLFLPGLRKSVRETPKGTASDWMGVIVPLIVVVLFVIVLIVLV